MYRFIIKKPAKKFMDGLPINGFVWENIVSFIP